MQNLSVKYNVRVIKIYRAAGHGKVLIDAISGLAAKANWRVGIVTQDYWFQNSSLICDYLESLCDSQVSDTNLDAKTINEKRLNKESLKVRVCVSQHIFEYVPNETNVFTREHLCSYE